MDTPCAEWQHPFVNVFKLCDVETMKEVESKGDVTEHMVSVRGVRSGAITQGEIAVARVGRVFQGVAAGCDV